MPTSQPAPEEWKSGERRKGSDEREREREREKRKREGEEEEEGEEKCTDYRPDTNRDRKSREAEIGGQSGVVGKDRR